jgi:hypothetical protein
MDHEIGWIGAEVPDVLGAWAALEEGESLGERWGAVGAVGEGMVAAWAPFVPTIASGFRDGCGRCRNNRTTVVTFAGVIERNTKEFVRRICAVRIVGVAIAANQILGSRKRLPR